MLHVFKEGQIKLKHKVQSIDYGKGLVSVLNSESSDVLNLEADYIISTVSLGVLQRQRINFEPALPDWKKAAIDDQEMGVYMKLFCNFNV